MRATLSAFLVALAASSALAQPPTKVTYVDHVLPLFKDKCVSCHNPDKMSSGLVLNNYTQLMEGGATGQVIKPGDPDSSKLFLTMTHKAQPHMPPKSPPLPKESLDLVAKWIAGGALETAGSKAPEMKPRTEIGLKSVVRGKPAGPPPMPSAKLSLEPTVRHARPNAVTALASNPWSPLVAVGGQKQVLLYHADTQELLGVLPFPEGQINVLRFSRNGSILLAAGGRGGKSGVVVLWSVTTGERITQVGDETDAVLAADISPDQTMVAVGGPSKVVRIYGTADGKKLHEIKKHTDWIYSIEFSPDGVLMATGDRNGGLFVWEAHGAREYFGLRGHTAAVTDVSWRTDSNVLVSCSEDTTIRQWEMENGGQIRSWGGHGGGCQSVRYAQDGRIVSSGRDRVVKVWDGNGGLQRQLEAFPDVALRATLTHDNAKVIGGDWSGLIRVWAAADGKALGMLVSNPPSVAERLDAAAKDVAAKEAAATAAAATATAAATAVTQATANLAAAQKAVTDTANAAKVATDAAAKAKAMADAANAAVVPANQAVTAKDVAAKAYAEAAAKVKAAADAAKDNKELAAQLTKATATATTAAQELAAAQKAATDAANNAKTLTAAVAPAQQAMAAAVANAAAAPKNVEAQTKALQAAQAKAATDKAAADQAAAAAAAAKAALERLKAVTATKTAAK